MHQMLLETLFASKHGAIIYRGYPYKILLLCIIVLFCGVFAELWFPDKGVNFARSGPVLVCIAIFLRVLHSRWLESMKTTNNFLAQELAFRKVGIGDGEEERNSMTAEQLEALRTVKREYLDNGNTKIDALRSLWKVDAYMASLGTLIWGFGDLLF